MKQVLQNLGSGETSLSDIPVPSVGYGQLLIQSHRSLVSIGTEKMLVEFGKASWLEKARKQPAKVKQVIDKIKTDGLSTTLEAVRSKLDQPIALGYSNAGTVIEVGPGVRGFKPGDRVVSNGPHAEYVVVPENLCSLIPDEVSFDEAAFTVVASIALQGVRLADPSFGETFVVTGLGLIGLITTQILIANGCRVIGLDISAEKCARAREYGATVVDLSTGADPVAAALAATENLGVDGVLITASTKSNEPVHQAALMCRKRGRIVLIGVTGLELQREDFYEKELSFQVSCSYGPGRYDEAYEGKGLDYPIGFVRWTARRNFDAILSAVASGQISFKDMITHRVPFENAASAYDPEYKSALGLMLEYPEGAPQKSGLERSVSLPKTTPEGTGAVKLGLVGAGGFTSLVMLPALQAAGADFKVIASSKGVTSTHLGKKFGFDRSTTDLTQIFDSNDVNTVFITTRHDSHSKYVIRALKAGKRVFVEKPLAITRDQLHEVKEAYESLQSPFVMVGFNRRFSPLTQKMKELMKGDTGRKTIVMTVNAGALPKEHWTQDPLVGGGRIIGEGCHFVDLVRYLIGHPITSVDAKSTKNAQGHAIEDEATITLGFADGSTATILYWANGSKTVSKERLEVFSSGKVLQLDNFITLKAFGWGSFTGLKLRKQDKGHNAEVAAFIEAAKTGKAAPIAWDELVEVTEACFTIVEQIHQRD